MYGFSDGKWPSREAESAWYLLWNTNGHDIDGTAEQRSRMESNWGEWIRQKLNQV
jgi:hypothetical protein